MSVYACMSLIHSVVCLTTGPQPLPNRVLHRVRSTASSFNLQLSLFSLRSSSSSLRLISRLPVTSTLPYIISSITCFRGKFLCNMWPIKVAIFFKMYVGYTSPPWLYVLHLHFSHDRSKYLLHLLQYHISNFSRYFWSNFRSVQVLLPYKVILEM